MLPAPLGDAGCSTFEVRCCLPRCGVFLLLLLLTLPSFAESPYATYTFGPLSGKKQMAQDAQRLYCLTKAGELRIYDKQQLRDRMKDIGQPPSPVGTLKLNGVPETLDWAGAGTLCIGTGNHLVLANVSRPQEPKMVSEQTVAGKEWLGASEVRAFGKHVYVASRKQGLLRFDLSDPEHLLPAGSLALKGFSYSVDVRSGLAVVATGIGLAFVDVSGPELLLKSTCDTLRNTEIVRFAGDHLVTCSKEYTTIYSLDDSLQPKELAELSTIDPFYFTHLCALHVTPEHLFVAGGEGGLYVHDWRIPEQPRTVIQYSFWGTKDRFTPQKKMEYVKAVGLAKDDKQAARHIAAHENNYIIAMGMAVDGPHVYLMDMNDQLWALEVGFEPAPYARCVVRP